MLQTATALEQRGTSLCRREGCGSSAPLFEDVAPLFGLHDRASECNHFGN
jgi:hypothetical protein